MYVKQLELTRFKSFGSTTTVPLLPGFTVISGPNGSGKSNILDALLFALGLSSSKGMRADKLLDLVHSASLEKGRKIETAVSVTFALDQVPAEFEVLLQSGLHAHAGIPSASDADHPQVMNGKGFNGSNGNGHHSSAPPLPTDWKVTRRLRVSPDKGSGPTYTSTFYINDLPCTLAELHEQLEAMHVYPNGYNVVLQGDVTSIISMNSKERRQIIDELAGVAAFDRKIAQATSKLDVVKEQIERFRLIEQELQVTQEKLIKECEKARKYQQLRQDLAGIQLSEQVVTWRVLEQKALQTRTEIQTLQQQQATADQQIQSLSTLLAQEEAQLAQLQSQINALGEEDYLKLQSQIANHRAQLEHYQQQIAQAHQGIQTAETQIQEAERRQVQLAQQLTNLAAQTQQLQHQHQTLTASVVSAQGSLASSRQQLQSLAQSSDAWVKQQQYLSRHLEQARSELAPRSQDHVRLTERLSQLERQQQTTTQAIQILTEQQDPSSGEPLQTATQAAETQTQSIAAELAQLQNQLETEGSTHQRLQAELHAKQRELDKLETRRQVLQDTQGSRATQVLIAADLPGVCGLVAQLAQVDPQYQTAVEIAAGSRLNFVVVEDDVVASSGIQFLKHQKAGRATFLPLNKLKSQRPPRPLQLSGLVDYAIRLVKFDDQYRDVFGFVLGDTLVMESLDRAQPHIGKHRMVTLAGELLETSGAMTGGSLGAKSNVHFGSQDSSDLKHVRDRIEDIQDLLATLTPRLKAAQVREKTLGQALADSRQTAMERRQQWQQWQQAQQQLQARLAELQQAQSHHQQEHVDITQRLADLSADIHPLQERIQDLTAKLNQLEHSPVNQHWQQAQTAVQELENQLSQLQTQLHQNETQQQQLLSQQQLNHTHQQQQQDRIQSAQAQIETAHLQISQLETLQHQTQAQIDEIQVAAAEAEARLKDLRATRDAQDFQIRSRQQQIQRLEWDRYNAQAQQQEKEAQRDQFQTQSQAARAVLPDPLPEVEESLTLEDLQKQRRRTEDKIRALEPVNMLALEESEAIQLRLDELSQKLDTLQQERTELLLRIENFATLRRQAFMDAFAAVDGHFGSIFAQLSDGDGYLQLENPEDPLAGGLTLVAHPKGKPVRRLNSMSGGEKSLTALSFIFALQRYRPSSFYAFDEVDMFLDGANVERLAQMIQQQAQAAQFIVVSLRRPMIEKADRTIGVTQARGAYTQVIGLSAH
ncbi:MAG: chromosome segregation protein SMC [Synechococcaceae cyanobacterium SM2_3_2]|nr:chromosome segregation protein SMC [Synechococcaceae cyanobacterium SM2_3_2]